MTPEQRARLGALAQQAAYDTRATTAAARKAALDRFARQVDPEGQLAPAERERRALAAKRAYFTRLAIKSAEVRAARAGALRCAAGPLARQCPSAGAMGPSQPQPRNSVAAPSGPLQVHVPQEGANAQVRRGAPGSRATQRARAVHIRQNRRWPYAAVFCPVRRPWRAHLQHRCTP